MDIYQRRSRQKWILAAVGLAIVVFSVFYTRYLAARLAVVEETMTQIWSMAQVDLNDTDSEASEYCDFTLHGFIISRNTSIPVIVVSEEGEVNYGANWGNEERSSDLDYLQARYEEFLAEEQKPINSFQSNIYFGESLILRQLRFFPFVQIALIGGFILVGFIGLNQARRSEQNRVWVGMAKETAHQLGTPITAITAWIEHLKLIRGEDEETMEIASELENDVERLGLIADRFSKIGSTPKLEPTDIAHKLEEARVYMQRRASRKVSFHFPDPEADSTFVNINPPLFDWVLENLLRNALDAMGGKGEISAAISSDTTFIHVDISDTGKGIPSANHKRVFQPGFTTKKRGWGLGLSLTKRIIEEYHRGKIFVKRSEEGKGTTFRISLPR